VVYRSKEIFEAPNWSPDGKYLLLNSRNKLWKLPVEGGRAAAVDTGTVTRLNNDHASRRMQVVRDFRRQRIYPASWGGEPKQIRQDPSYYHTWAPDGRA